ncbi:sigma-54 interaction domain-containing protein [Terrisporobacter mayombei]|uniref:Anaerobic nitric oxide reductase transcription regulator NorR n=1 Tax=Terrisporobacter mayombei TaxID=1541 RepID=A0ABY9Q6M2_9FIRM|nr:sigma 54-interacting transcriptional regulator [Terrisporobacter mayombei]MCC3868701.1 sigma 54-interacting transcriptional regulator [Terrisporobacter mayombei]WMT83173.1 Anaerobic nitric oxide reductase transcription regulator NorR [Terrisporobacter mayombei]
MKTIGIVTDGVTKLEIFLNENIRLIFGEKVKINNYQFKNLEKNHLIDDDVILVMINDRVVKVKEYVDDTSKIIKINRSIRQKDIYKLFALPEGMDVLVVNDNEHTIIETISSLYGLGVNHLNFVLYNKNIDQSNIKVAVTPGESNLVPNYIENIIDLGHRYIDSSTFIQIMTKLKIEDKDVTKNLIKYCDEVISLYSGINNTYKHLTIINEELNSIINLSQNGMILISNKNEITICNESLKNILDMDEYIVGMKVTDIDNVEVKKIFELKEAEDEVVKFKNKYLNINKYKINSFGKNTGTYFCIQEITHIKKLEQNLSKKLRYSGQIARYNFDDIKTQSLILENTIKLAKRIAKSDHTVLITGESGTGKELMAQSIHNESLRANQPFIAVNCAAMPESLMESELFGYEEGSFTGALRGGKKGLFEQANNGTIFLDEIGDMPVYVQTKLLRVIQEQQVMRIGSNNIINIDVRIIAATNRDLFKMVKEEKFRSDLYYRINVLPINIPALKDRKEDILMLLQSFIPNKRELSDEVKNILNKYDWPGNIRELRNVALYIDTMVENNKVTIENLPYYLLNYDLDEDIKNIQMKFGLNKIIEVIDIIRDFNLENKSAGRSSIMNRLKEKEVVISEGEVRNILASLKELDIIESEAGRKGSELTNKGIRLLNKIGR